jgi:hypothetical protein
MISPRSLAVSIALGLSLFACFEPEGRRPGMRLAGEVSDFPGDWRFSDAHREIAIEVATPYFIAHSVTILECRPERLSLRRGSQPRGEALAGLGRTRPERAPANRGSDLRRQARRRRRRDADREHPRRVHEQVRPPRPSPRGRSADALLAGRAPQLNATPFPEQDDARFEETGVRRAGAGFAPQWEAGKAGPRAATTDAGAGAAAGAASWSRARRPAAGKERCWRAPLDRAAGAGPG